MKTVIANPAVWYTPEQIKAPMPPKPRPHRRTNFKFAELPLDIGQIPKKPKGKK
jgi:hypothetical protein